MQPVYIVSSARTPIGSFNGALSSLTATQLGSEAIKAVVKKAKINPELITEVFMGNVLSAGLGQSPARQAALFAGLSESVVCTTVNKVCASGMKAVMLGAQSIMLGINDLVIAGGMESMSNTPYYLDKARTGYKLGHGQIFDGILKDGLWDVYNNIHMGTAAEIIAKEMHITREMQDAHAIQSYQRSAKAWENNLFKNEVIPVKSTKGKEIIEVTQDEEFKIVNFDKIPNLKPVFENEGTITAANASTINDGAGALLLASEMAVQKYKLEPLAIIIGFADAAQEPKYYTTSPALAIPKAIEYAGIKQQNVDFFEINEAFSVVALANIIKLNIENSRCNIYGGAVSLGHPLGASGVRIISTLMSVLSNNASKIGVAGICNGGGGASAIVIKML
ncbi:MAG: acetyl-CoA C-acyltransferase [Bacteroidota bacterium]|nr:acetyl-CoA C-acyltransferase [Bacteroidota bacterium]